MKKTVVFVIVLGSLMIAAGLIGAFSFEDRNPLISERVSWFDGDCPMADEDESFMDGFMGRFDDGRRQVMEDFRGDVNRNYPGGFRNDGPMMRNGGMMGREYDNDKDIDWENVDAISEEEAYNIAIDYIASEQLEQYILSEDARVHHGVYAFTLSSDDEIVGMLMVDAVTQEVWSHILSEE